MYRYWFITWMCAMGLMNGGAPATALPIPGAGVVLYVDDDAPRGGDGMSWETAFRFLRDALTYAAEPEHDVSDIRVAQGAYRPDRDDSTPDGTGERAVTFSLADGLALVGGYAGLGAEDPDARNVELYETILTGDLAADDGPDFINNDENSYHVVSIGNGREAIIDGCTITAGNADGDGGDDMFGGGIYNRAEVTIIACRVADNSADMFGGVYSSNPQVTALDSVFSGNEGGAHGAHGGVFTGCLFIGNHGHSGAAVNGALNVALIDCTFIENTAADRGGAVSAGWALHAIDCTFIGSSAGTRGGAVDCVCGPIMLEGCVFDANSSMEEGGAMWLGGFPSPDDLVVDCFFTGNHAAGEGGAMSIHGSPLGGPTLADCTFTGNTAHLGGGVCVDTLPAESVNCLFHANSAYHGGGMYAKWGCVQPPVLDGHLFLENEATEGGGLYVSEAELTVTDCVFEGNAAVHGGAMRTIQSAPSIIDTAFTGNLALLDGGGMRSEQSTINLNGCTFAGNEASRGGGLRNAETNAIVERCTFSDNRAAAGGGALYRADDSPTIVGECAFTGNEADAGGGIYGPYDDPSHLTLADSYLCQNVPDHIRGSWVDAGGNEFCPLSDGDINVDGVIDTADLLLLLGAWGDCPPPPDDCSADLNGDHRVDVLDLLILLGNWG